MRTHTSISRKDTRMYLTNNVEVITRIDELHDHLFVLRRIVLENFLRCQKKENTVSNAF